MKSIVKLIPIAAILFGLSLWLDERPRELPAPPSEQDAPLATAYHEWLAARGEDESTGRILVSVGWSKGLSSQFSKAHGEALIDLDRNRVSMSIHGLSDPEGYDVWLIDNQGGPGMSVRPETGDVMLRLGRLANADRMASLDVQVPRLSEVEPDLIVVTRAGVSPQAGILFGVPSLFQRVYAREHRTWGERGELASHRSSATRWSTRLTSTVHAAGAPPVDFDQLIEHGRVLFQTETFDGNGRTCGTCHPAKNNFTIDPTFIATLPPDDPLFVAEFIPELAENFEKPVLMRELGLILENVDGFDDLPNKFVMRAVPPTVGLRVQLKALPLGLDGTTIPPRHRTGWGGDGAPGEGTLREFAIGAINQHLPLTLNREPGVDFRFPTDEELDALEAFQLSMGRQEDINLRRLRLTGNLPRAGRRIFRRLIGIGPFQAGKCNACHGNAGARDSVVPGNFVINFNTGVEDLPDQPADRLDPNNPPDGGFGRRPQNDGSFGNGTFSTTPVVESADTAPFFHNNSINTIEEAVDFYNTDAFNDSPAGRLVGGIDLDDHAVQAVAAFLRVVNALENIRYASALQSGQQRVGADQTEDLEVSLAELQDATEVLEEANLHPDAIGHVRNAMAFVESAILDPDPNSRQVAIDMALVEEQAARDDMVRRRRHFPF